MKPTVVAALAPIKAGNDTRSARTVFPPLPFSDDDDPVGGFRKSNLKSVSWDRIPMRSTALGARRSD